MQCDNCDAAGCDCWKAREYGCERDREEAKLAFLASGKCPQTTTPLITAGTINLLDIPAVVYTCDNANGKARQPRVTKLLNGLGFTNWRFFRGQIGHPYWDIIRHDHAKLLRENDPPFLYLEDDIAIREFHTSISPPERSQIVYLGGGGAWRSSRLVREAQKQLPHNNIQRVRDIGWQMLEESADWVRVFGMFGTHALLYLNQAVMLEVADLMDSSRQPPDVTLGANQWRWFCSLPKIPLFYQTDGHNNNGTYDYSPRAECSRKARPAAVIRGNPAMLRKQRRAVLARR